MASKAPARMRLSTTRLFRSSPCRRWQKSGKERKGPSAWRWASTALVKPRPTPFRAARPKRMSWPATVKSGPDWLMSGGSRRMPMERHSAMYSAIYPWESSTEVRRAAMYSRG